MVEDEAQVFKVEHRVDVRNNLLTKPILALAADLQPVFPVADLCDLRVDFGVLQDERAGVEVEEVKL